MKERFEGEPNAVAVAMDLSPQQVAELAGIAAVMEQVPARLTPLPVGTLVTGDIAFVSAIARKTSAESTNTVYLISYDSVDDFFACLLLNRGEEQAVYEEPPGEGDDLPRLETVAGARAPLAILQAFGIAPALLGM
jgi:hypothetical protein